MASNQSQAWKLLTEKLSKLYITGSVIGLFCSHKLKQKNLQSNPNLSLAKEIQEIISLTGFRSHIVIKKFTFSHAECSVDLTQSSSTSFPLFEVGSLMRMSD